MGRNGGITALGIAVVFERSGGDLLRGIRVYRDVINMYFF